MGSAADPRRAEIWLVQFDPSLGDEIRKLRPAVVVNVDTVGRLALRIVVPLTDWQSSFAAFPWFVPIRANQVNGLKKDSGADVFQVKSIANLRMIRRIGGVSDDQMDEIAATIALCVGAA